MALWAARPFGGLGSARVATATGPSPSAHWRTTRSAPCRRHAALCRLHAGPCGLHASRAAGMQPHAARAAGMQPRAPGIHAACMQLVPPACRPVPACMQPVPPACSTMPPACRLPASCRQRRAGDPRRPRRAGAGRRALVDAAGISSSATSTRPRRSRSARPHVAPQHGRLRLGPAGCRTFPLLGAVAYRGMLARRQRDLPPDPPNPTDPTHQTRRTRPPDPRVRRASGGPGGSKLHPPNRCGRVLEVVCFDTSITGTAASRDRTADRGPGRGPRTPRGTWHAADASAA